MKKVLMVIFVLSLLGLLAVPVLANVLAGADCVAGIPPPGGGHREDGLGGGAGADRQGRLLAARGATLLRSPERDLGLMRQQIRDLPCWSCLHSAGRASPFSKL